MIAAPDPFSPLMVLVADPDPELRAALERLLTDLGCRCQAAAEAMRSASLSLEQTVRGASQTAADNLAAADQMSELNNRAVAGLDNVSAVVEENTASTEEMAAGSTEVTTAVENIASVSEENSAAVEEVSASAEELRAQVAEVTEAAQTLTGMAQTLQALVRQFKLTDEDLAAGDAPPVSAPAAQAAPARILAGHGNGQSNYHGNSRAYGRAKALVSAVARGIYVWDEATMSTGDAKVDQQHRELLRQINQLLEAMAAGRGQGEIRGILDFLGKYVEEHFGWEEDCMERHHCPVAEVNKRAHAKFIENYQTLRARYEQEGPSSELVLQIRQKVGDWLVSHIRRTDATLKTCIKRAA